MTTRRRPRIAINGELGSETGDELRLRERYAQAVWRAGGLPFVLPPIAEEAYLDELLATADGFLLSGGDDFETESLGLGPTHAAAKPVPAAKQAFDLALARRLVDDRVPTLGICYGMQLLALAEGATLWQDLPSECPDAQEHRGGVLHEVRVTPGSKLAAHVGVEPLVVVSRHHQALASPPQAARGWAACAHDGQGLLEAIELSEAPFLLGVQWHPELATGGPGDARQGALFRALVEAAIARTDLRAARPEVLTP